MKRTSKQKELFMFLNKQLYYWNTTNDIESPTHYSDMEEDITNLEFLSSQQKEELKELTRNFFNFIKSIQ